MRIHFIGTKERTKLIIKDLVASYGYYSLQEADVIVALGGDGLMLHVIHETIDYNLPIYGLNYGNLGFLTNSGGIDTLLKKLEMAATSTLVPLVMEAVDSHDLAHTAFAINEVYLLRQTHQAAKLKITISGIVRMEEMVSDGIIVSTPAGSTAYNLSAHGPILPIGSNLLALTSLNTFRPRRWHGALLKNSDIIEIDIIEDEKRPVCAVADYLEFRDIKHVSVKQDAIRSVRLLFDPDQKLEDKILGEQFLV